MIYTCCDSETEKDNVYPRVEVLYGKCGEIVLVEFLNRDCYREINCSEVEPKLLGE